LTRLCGKAPGAGQRVGRDKDSDSNARRGARGRGVCVLANTVESQNADECAQARQSRCAIVQARLEAHSDIGYRSVRRPLRAVAGPSSSFCALVKRRRAGRTGHQRWRASSLNIGRSGMANTCGESRAMRMRRVNRLRDSFGQGTVIPGVWWSLELPSMSIPRTIAPNNSRAGATLAGDGLMSAPVMLQWWLYCR